MVNVKHILVSCLLIYSVVGVQPVIAQTTPPAASTSEAHATTSESATTTAPDFLDDEQSFVAQTSDTVRSEKTISQTEIFAELEKRPIAEPTIFNFFAYWVQQAIFIGIPANTIFLILLAPIIALCISFTRVVIGLPTLDMLVPIALAFAFVSIGVGVGLFILLAIVVASYVAKILVNRVRMMFYPKRSLSMFILSIFVLAALTAALQLEYEQVLDLSIFPILILMLLGDSIVSVQLHKSTSETVAITTTTIALGLFGYVLATSATVQNILILYPELVLVVIPLNILIGRYFGLRVTELFRFKEFVKE